MGFPRHEMNGKDQFERTRLMYGEIAFNKIMNAKITIFGIGAVGGYALEAAARAGTGNITVYDFDTICPTNINRQILADHSTVGMKKIEAAEARVKLINPDCRFTGHDVFVNGSNVDELLREDPGIVIDAIDSVRPKVELLYALYGKGIPAISSMGAALRTDPTGIRHGELMETYHCPLAATLRKRLRRKGVTGISGITAIFSEEMAVIKPVEPQTQKEPHPTTGHGRKERILGSLPGITGIFGLHAAQLALNLIAYGR